MNKLHQALRKLRFNRVTIARRPFYKRYPYTNKISINSADDRGCVDFELGFFCNRIPKAANSTVITNIAWLKCGDMLPPKEAKKVFLTPAQLSAEELDRFDALFKFTVARNPYSRTLSAYLEKIARRAERANQRVPSFSEFLDGLERDLLYSNAHWAPQSDLLLIPPHEFDLIGKVETLDQDMRTVNQRIQPSKTLPMNPAVKHATGANNKLLAYYDDATIARVAALFAQDFEVFGYSKALALD